MYRLVLFKVYSESDLIDIADSDMCNSDFFNCENKLYEVFDRFRGRLSMSIKSGRFSFVYSNGFSLPDFSQLIKFNSDDSVKIRKQLNKSRYNSQVNDGKISIDVEIIRLKLAI